MLSGNQATGFDVTFMWFDKNTLDRAPTDVNSVLVASTTCSAVTNAAVSNAPGNARMSQQTCCPAAAAVPDGVRCTRFGFVP